MTMVTVRLMTSESQETFTPCGEWLRVSTPGRRMGVVSMPSWRRVEGKARDLAFGEVESEGGLPL